MQISVVIPTCNRKKQLLFLLENLNSSSYPLREVIIVDSGEDRLQSAEYVSFENLNIYYMESEKSVCLQRNIGIAKSENEWVFLCDDDIEVPNDYIEKLVRHLKKHIDAIAVSGLFLQKDKNEWVEKYSITSSGIAMWRYIFQLSIWGEINCETNLFTRSIKNYYKRKGNHISKAGWPVITDFTGDFFKTPVYSLGASLVKKQLLIDTPFDEVLDSHGIGENYGITISFPTGVHVLNNAFVYHHRIDENRLQKPLSYYRRVLALDYFRKTKRNIKRIKKHWFIWSLTGNLISFIFARNCKMTKAGAKTIWVIILNMNPYYRGAVNNEKFIKPEL